MDLLKKIIAAAVLAPFMLSAQNTFTNNQLLGQLNTITTAVPFLLIAPNARAGAMGETGAATSPDVYSMHWNVAKLAFAKEKYGVGLSYTPWLRALIPDINHGYLSLYMKPDSVSAITASARYFSMGTITYTSITGATIGQYKPYEFAIDAGYSRRIAKYWSLGMAFRFIHSDLTNGITVANRATYPGRSYAGDLGVYYMDRDRVKILNRTCVMMMGLALTNVGSKIKYTDSVRADFIPINLRVGQGFRVNFDSHHSLSFQYELNKLLVPTPPVYALDSNGNPMTNSSGQYVIAAGKDPNVSVPQGMIQSFNDAPGGGKEELREINYCIGFEYMYNNTFAVRTGYFYEAKTKGNRQFLTLGTGVRFNFVTLDFAYLIPTNGQRSPLQNTLRFSLQFQFDRFKNRPPVRKHNVGF
jgi:hypothetical protein